MPVHVSSTICSSSGDQEVKLYYTASGIITPVGGRPVQGLRDLCTGRPPAECDDTRGCIIQF